MTYGTIGNSLLLNLKNDNIDYKGLIYMHKITELPAWERLFKRIIWKQLGGIKGKKILDFGSGEGITANHFAKDNEVVAL